MSRFTSASQLRRVGIDGVDFDYLDGRFTVVGAAEAHLGGDVDRGQKRGKRVKARVRMLRMEKAGERVAAAHPAGELLGGQPLLGAHLVERLHQPRPGIHLPITGRDFRMLKAALPTLLVAVHLVSRFDEGNVLGPIFAYIAWIGGMIKTARLGRWAWFAIV